VARLPFESLADFVDCNNPEDRHKREAKWGPEKNQEGRLRKCTYEEMLTRENISLHVSG
jgi:type I restriction enzyme M protein